MRTELARKGVTRRLLWREYREREPQGLEYSQYCELYRRWSKTQDLVLRFEHAAGDKLFIDYAGLTIGITDRHSGRIEPAQMFTRRWVTRPTRTPRRWQRSKRPIGSRATCARWNSWAACRRRW